MFRKKLWVLLVIVLCLSGCAKTKQPTQKALDFRAGLMNAGSCSFLADIVADYGERTYAFTVEAEHSPQETKLTVVSPEEISGISAIVSENGAQIVFDGLELDFGELANGYVSPVSVPWLLGQCWVGEYISCAGADGEYEKVTYLRGYNDAELTVDTWFTKENIPVYAEIIYDGRRCLTVQIRDFQM